MSPHRGAPVGNGYRTGKGPMHDLLRAVGRDWTLVKADARPDHVRKLRARYSALHGVEFTAYPAAGRPGRAQVWARRRPEACR